ncbi:MAG: hypothetical protein LBB79_01720 [Prevotellaceae bacterium]|jgi:hypothetical protein|nr:hypothetical protein [Prevotellaceae bacterium]
MSTEENNTAQNAPGTLPEIMEQLKTAIGKASQSVQAGNAIDPLTLNDIVELIHDAELLFNPFANTFTPKDRTRFVGGIKNLGFIETSLSFTPQMPQFFIGKAIVEFPPHLVGQTPRLVEKPKSVFAKNIPLRRN